VSALIELNASNNQLRTLSVADLINLKTLDISDNLLTTLDLTGLTNLETVALSGNYFANESSVIGLGGLNLSGEDLVFGEQKDPATLPPTAIGKTAATKQTFAVSFAGIRNGEINLNLKAGNYTAELYNLQGRLVSSVNINALNGLNATGIKTNNLSKGMFILNVKQAGASVLKQKLRI